MVRFEQGLTEDVAASRPKPSSEQANGYHGDVVYDVTVELTDPEAARSLRCGLTAVVRIKIH